MVFKQYLSIEKNQINLSYSLKFTVQYVRDNEYRNIYTSILCRAADEGTLDFHWFGCFI